MEMEIQSAGITLKSETRIYHQKNGKKINVYSSLYTDKCRYEIQEQREVPVWYTGIYRPISSTGHNVQCSKNEDLSLHTHTHNVEP
jgi:hypothetical protein